VQHKQQQQQQLQGDAAWLRPFNSVLEAAASAALLLQMHHLPQPEGAQSQHLIGRVQLLQLPISAAGAARLLTCSMTFFKHMDTHMLLARRADMTAGHVWSNMN